MAERVRVDVAVIGGGPAGAAAALALCRFTPLQVAVVEATDYRQVRVGETVSPAIQPLLHYLGLWERFVGDGHLSASGTAAAWGAPALVERSYLLGGRGDGWHLDRRRFDRMLAAAAGEGGARVLTGTRLTAVSGGPGAWQLVAEGRDGRRELTAAYLIDAGGQQATVARRLGARAQVHDRLLAVLGVLGRTDRRTRPIRTVVETCPEGWWYSAMLPSGRMVAALMTDAAALRRQGLQQPEVWLQRLAAAPHTGAHLRGTRLRPPLHVRPASSRLLTQAGGAGWVAAGDAVASFDPLAAMGVGHAISTGIHAARVAYDWLHGNGSLLAAYQADVARNFQQYLRMRHGYYCLEQRWPDEPFWAGRHQLPALAGVG